FRAESFIRGVLRVDGNLDCRHTIPSDSLPRHAPDGHLADRFWSLYARTLHADVPRTGGDTSSVPYASDPISGSEGSSGPLSSPQPAGSSGRPPARARRDAPGTRLWPLGRPGPWSRRMAVNPCMTRSSVPTQTPRWVRSARAGSGV